MGMTDMFSKMFNKEQKKGSESDDSVGILPAVENRNIDERAIDESLKTHEGNIVSEPADKVSSDEKTEDPLPASDDLQHEEVKEENSAKTEQVTEEKILDVLGDVYDPEIPIDIVNLGLIYGVEIADGIVHVKATMTSPGCPSSAEIVAESKMLIEQLPGVKSVLIDIVWDPPWDPSRMSEEAKQSMGM